MPSEDIKYRFGSDLNPNISGRKCYWDSSRHRRPGKRLYLKEHIEEGHPLVELAYLDYLKTGVIKAVVADDDHVFSEFSTFPEARLAVVEYILAKEQKQAKGRGMSRAEKAGRLMGHALVEMVHLMYQKNTARNFLKGLLSVLQKEADNRP